MEKRQYVRWLALGHGEKLKRETGNGASVSALLEKYPKNHRKIRNRFSLTALSLPDRIIVFLSLLGCESDWAHLLRMQVGPLSLWVLFDANRTWPPFLPRGARNCC